MKPKNIPVDAVTVANAARVRPSVGKVAYRIVAQAGPDQGREWTIDPAQPGATWIGQGESCEILLSDRQVSRRHGSMEIVSGKLRLRDFGSTNGTRVNGIEIGEAWLLGGETVAVGESSLRVHKVQREKEAFVSLASGFGRLLGESVAMRRLYPLCEKLAASTVPVVIEGETGTGKEVLAEALHEMGPRARGPFGVFDCTAIGANLVEAALFGHERGSFTGATDSREGIFEETQGGTLLIDEIGDLSLDLQAKLLRVLERSEVRRIGGKRWIKVDVRVLSATRRNLEALVSAGRFRDDLFYRLAVARVELPPLRERGQDIQLLAAHFWRRLDGAGDAPPPELQSRIDGYAWPGNVRELHNAVARWVALGELASEESHGGAAKPLGRPTVPGEDVVEQALSRDLPFPRARQEVLEAFEMRYVERVLERHGGRVAEAAEASGIALRYFQLVRARVKKRPPKPGASFVKVPVA